MLKPRDAPDVVRSTYAGEGEQRRPGGGDYSIDNLFGVPAKISIPERYVPEQVPYLAVPNLWLFIISVCFHIEVFSRQKKTLNASKILKRDVTGNVIKYSGVADVLTVAFPIKLPLCDFLIWLDVPFNALAALLGVSELCVK